MEYALWNNIRISASEISNYEEEKKLRLSSKNRELKCCDPDCQSDFVKYCHGDVKEPYFAHCGNNNCDYAVYESGISPEIGETKRLLYNHLRSKGYQTEIEAKILKRHYSHILLTLENKNKTAIEFLTTNVTPGLTDRLTREYETICVNVQWIVISDIVYVNKDQASSYAKRHSFNETRNNTLLIIHPFTKEVFQYRKDVNSYAYDGRKIEVNGFNEMFFQKGKIDDLCVEKEEITLTDFNKQFDKWLERKQETYKNICLEREEKKRQEDKIREERLLKLKEEEKRQQSSKSYTRETIEQPQRRSYAYTNAQDSNSNKKGRECMRVKITDNMVGKDIIYKAERLNFGTVVEQGTNEKGQIYIVMNLDGVYETQILEELIEKNQIFYNN